VAPFEGDLEIESRDQLTKAQGPVGTSEAGTICTNQSAEHDQHISDPGEGKESMGHTASRE
jgi:hypothetical protein